MRTTVPFKHLLAVALLALALVGCSTVRAAPPDVQQVASSEAADTVSRYITVVGTGKVNLAPDVAEINVGAEAMAGTVSEAKAEVDRQIAAILSTLKELGIHDKDIQTSSYSIYFERAPSPSPIREGAASEPQGGYRVSSTLTITIRDVAHVGDVLDAVVAAGANQVYGVNFTVADDQKWQSEARAKAVADAKSRAGELALLSGVELGNVLSISEVIGSTPGLVPMKMVESAIGGAGIAPGELELSTQIQITFAIQ
jgi:uncharacterized protein YggE